MQGKYTPERYQPCVHCGASFYNPLGRTQRYCSVACRAVACREERRCAWCGTAFVARRAQTRRHCSQACARAARAATATSYRNFVTADGRHMKVHRHIAEQQIGRALTSDEVVHHRNGDIHDNRPENLQVMTWAEHNRVHKQGIRHVEWSSYSPACRECGRSDRPHQAHGLCRTCHHRQYMRERKLNTARWGRWSRKFAECRECRTTNRPHGCHGYCITCYHRLRKHGTLPKARSR